MLRFTMRNLQPLLDMITMNRRSGPGDFFFNHDKAIKNSPMDILEWGIEMSLGSVDRAYRRKR